jgi:GNAT superfamily N-acetyltransferase
MGATNPAEARAAVGEQRYMPAGAETAPKHYENVDSFREHWNALGVRNMTDIRAKGTPYEHIRPSEIEVDKANRNKGLGTAFMEDLVAFADLTGKQIRINPSDELGATSKGRLEKFYKRFGFVENKPGKNKDYAISERFYRQPSSGERFMPASDDIRFMPDYSGEHKAPQRDYGAPLDNLKGVYPDDVYGPNAAQYYGHSSGDATDKAAARIIQATKGKPDAPVKVFRAIPKSIQSNEINPGDWITTIKSYAVDHGEGPLGGDYKILEKTVPAGDLYTNGDSIFEFGYDPKFMPSPDSAMPGAYSFPGGYRALSGKTKGSFRIYGPAGSLLGIASSLDEAQRIIRKKSKQ